jgi:hypothetical protein
VLPPPALVPPDESVPPVAAVAPAPPELPPVEIRPPVPEPPGELFPLQPTHSHTIIRYSGDVEEFFILIRSGSLAPAKQLTLAADF